MLCDICHESPNASEIDISLSRKTWQGQMITFIAKFNSCDRCLADWTNPLKDITRVIPEDMWIKEVKENAN